MLKIAGLAVALTCAAATTIQADWRKGCLYETGRTIDEIERALGAGSVEIVEFSDRGFTARYDYYDGESSVVEYIYDRDRGTYVAWTGRYSGGDAPSAMACSDARRRYWEGGNLPLRCVQTGRSSRTCTRGPLP